MATNEGDQHFILYAVLPDINKYLDVDLIAMHLLATNAISSEDYATIIKLRENGSRRRMCTEIVRIIDQRNTLDRFITALENSKVEHVGHEDILKKINEEKERRAAKVTKTKCASPNQLITLEPYLPDRGMPNLDGVEDEEADKDGPFEHPVRVKKLSSTSSYTAAADNIAAKIDDSTNHAPANSTESANNKSSISSFCLGSMCAGLGVIIILLAAGGIALMYYAARDFHGEVTCKNLVPTDTPDSERSLKASSIYAFNFMSGFLCLTIPVIFVLLLIHGICNEFKKNVFNKSFMQKALIVIIIAYIAVCIVVGVGELALSIQVAIFVYGNYAEYRDNLRSENASVADAASTDCKPEVYFSAFTSLTMLYILVFVMLSVMVGLLIASYVKQGYNTIVYNWFATCLRSFRTLPTPLINAEAQPSVPADQTTPSGAAVNTKTTKL